MESVKILKGKARKVAQCDLQGNIIKIFTTDWTVAKSLSEPKSSFASFSIYTGLLMYLFMIQI
mgnify:CR=1 FL=1